MMEQPPIDRTFNFLYDLVVEPVVNIVFDEIADQDFKDQCSVRCLLCDEYRAELKKAFYECRGTFKQEYYKLSRNSRALTLLDSDGESLSHLDFNKLGGVMVAAMLRVKPFYYEISQAISFQKKNEFKKKFLRKRKELNIWLVEHVYACYKAAYLAGMQTAYIGLVHDLKKELENAVPREDQVKFANQLHELIDNKKSIHTYNFELNCSEKQDSFMVNVITGLAEAEARGREVDILLCSMLLYQQVQYTKQLLEYNY